MAGKQKSYIRKKKSTMLPIKTLTDLKKACAQAKSDIQTHMNTDPECPDKAENKMIYINLYQIEQLIAEIAKNNSINIP